MPNSPTYEQLAMDRVKRGNDNTDAIVFALLAVAEAIKDANSNRVQ